MSSESEQREEQIDEIVDRFLDSPEWGDYSNQEELVAKYPELAPDLENRLKLAFAVRIAFLSPHREMSGVKSPSFLNCPHCGNRFRIVDDANDLTCGGCGSSFAILEESPKPTGKPKAFLGRYKITGRLGSGAFGVVYRARDTKLNRVVAIKQPRPRLFDSAKEAQLFLRVAQNTANLEHPNIVRVYEVGDADSPYIVSEYIDGQTLEQLAANERLAFRETARILASVGDGVACAHASKVIHRDIKPSNILLDQRREPYITDFGLAKGTEATITLTRDGELIGTPAYMSPEQAAMETADTRSDVYSLGVVLYRLLSGELPFRGSQRILLQQVMHDAPKPPSQINEYVPKDLETIALTAMQKDPGARIQSAQEFSRELRRWLAGEPILSRRTSRLERCRRWCLRNPIISSLSAVSALLVLILSVGSFYWAVTASSQVRATQKGHAATLTERGLLAIENQDIPSGLPHFVEALDLYERLGDKEAAQLSRVRIGRSIADTPFLSHVEACPHRVDSIVFSHDSSMLFASFGTQVIGLQTTDWTRAIDLRLQTRAGRILLNAKSTRLACVPHHSANTAVAGAPQSVSSSAELWDSIQARRLAFLQHDATVSSVAFSPTESIALTTGLDGFAKVWDASNGELITKLEQPGSYVTNAWFSPNGTYALVHSMQATLPVRWRLRIYESSDWSNSTDVSPEGYVHDVAFGDGVTVVSDAGVRSYSLPQGMPLDDWNSSLLGPQRIKIASPGVGLIKLKGGTTTWNLSNNSKRLARAVNEESWVETGFDISPDGTFFASLNGKHGLAVRWTSDEELICAPMPNNELVTCLKIGAENRFIAVGAANGTIRVWDMAGATRGRQRLATGAQASSPQFALNEKLLGALLDGNVAVWEKAEGEFVAKPKWSRKSLKFRFNRTGSTVASLASARDLELLNSSDGRPIAAYEANSKISQIEFSPFDENTLAIGTEDGNVLIWKLPEPTPVSTSLHNRNVGAIAFHPNGELIATGSADKQVQVWRIRDGSVVCQAFQENDSVVFLSFSRDGRDLLVSSSSWVTVWNWQAQTRLHRHRKRTQYCNSTFTPAKEYFIALTVDAFVGRWRVGPDPDSIVSIREQDVRWLQCQPRGRQLLIAGGGSTGFVKFFDSVTLKLSAPPIRYSQRARAVFSPKGSSVLMTSDAGSVELMQLRPTSESVPSLRMLASALSGRKYDGNEHAVIPSQEYAGLHERLQASWPNSTRPTASERTQWSDIRSSHRLQLVSPNSSD